MTPEGLDWVDYTHDTAYGRIGIRWERRKGRFEMRCEVPVGTVATVWVPFSDAAPKVEEGPNVRNRGVRDGYALYEVDAGKYVFKSELK